MLGILSTLVVFIHWSYGSRYYRRIKCCTIWMPVMWELNVRVTDCLFFFCNFLSDSKCFQPTSLETLPLHLTGLYVSSYSRVTSFKQTRIVFVILVVDIYSLPENELGLQSLYTLWLAVTGDKRERCFFLLCWRLEFYPSFINTSHPGP